MSEFDPNRTAPDQSTRKTGWGMPAGLFAALAIALLAIIGIGTRYHLRGDLNVIHCLLSLFFASNLVICYWEICLFLRRDYVETRAGYWRSRQRETGRTPAVEFLCAKVPFRRMLSPTVWADVWATYSLFDGSFSDRRSWGFNADVANGFVTPVPTLILYAACTVDFMPAVLAGIVGLALSWQWSYVTSVYWVSFFMARRQRHITRGELYVYIGALNAPWVLFALLGVYVSGRLILDGSYSVLGY
ncbi:MAG: hypothetical protein OXU79_07245 [Gemmatimonadota bacterium]|nr:hypothetical protein [Gemmatimonadota bacterium]